MTEVDAQPSVDFTHVGPGTLAGRYLRMFWQPIYRSQDLPPGRAVPVRIAGENLTVYRGEGRAVHVVALRCAHRGTQLSVGWVEEDCIRCRYHGWKFDGSGQCVEQPGEDPSFAERIRIRGYPAEEYLGLIFAYLGEGEAPPLRRHPDFDVAGVLETCVPEYWPCNYFNRLDNAGDVGHVPFAHREAVRRIGRGDRMAVREVHAEETEYGVRSWSVVPGRPNECTHFHMRNTNQITANTRVEGSLEDAQTLRGNRISWRVPVDDDNTVSFSVDLLYLEGAEAEAYRQRRRETETLGADAPPPQMGDAILAGRVREEDLDARLSTATLFSVQDYVTQVGQAIADRTQDRLGKNDVGLALMRKLWERELRALEEGRPLTEWRTRPGLAAMSNPLAAEFAAGAGKA